MYIFILDYICPIHLKSHETKTDFKWQETPQHSCINSSLWTPFSLPTKEEPGSFQTLPPCLLWDWEVKEKSLKLLSPSLSSNTTPASTITASRGRAPVWEPPPCRRVEVRLRNKTDLGVRTLSETSSSTTLQEYWETRTITYAAIAISSLITSQLVLYQLAQGLPSIQARRLMWLKDYLLSFLSRLQSFHWTPGGHTSLGSSGKLALLLLSSCSYMLQTHTKSLTLK